ncbi:glycerol kinase GlpK [Candidatus Woesearchaeota archaeon]|nr:glycerol kinase GlpK [Candidatus Woesearchaeota archaeon]
MHIISIDQGTTGTTTVLYDQEGNQVDKIYKEITQFYPKPGWVEHDPIEIWQSIKSTVKELLVKNRVKISAIGITNQRETTVLWNKNTGKPVYNAIVWQCRRTSEICSNLREHEKMIRKKTGLPLDPYLSGTKIRWILDNVKGLPNVDDLLFGTIDTWIIWNLTNGKVHATDFTNASRTLLFNIETKEWDDELCRIIDIPKGMLPEIKHSMGDYGEVEAIEELKGVHILGVAGDQQAALFGQLCFDEGQIKNTYGTGCFILMNTGKKKIESSKGLITTLAIDKKGEACYAIEGSVFIAGAAVQWLRDELKILENAQESEKAALAVEDTGGVYLVPAFTGLGAPYWNMEARGALVGLTRGTNRNHIIRAALKSIAFQSYDVIDLMEKETYIEIKELAVDGGASQNNFLMQFQADMLDKTIIRKTIESTSLGAAYLAGIKAGVYTIDKLSSKKEKIYTPNMPDERRQELLKGWHKAIRQVQTE